MNEILNDEIRNTLDNWISAFNSHDLDALMQVYDPEINYVSHTAPRKTSIPDIKAGFKSNFSIKPHITFKEEQVIASEQLGFASGIFQISGTNPQNNSKFEEAGRVVVIFQKVK